MVFARASAANNVLNSSMKQSICIVVKVVYPRIAHRQKPKISITSANITMPTAPKTFMQRASETTVLFALSEYIGSLAGTFRSAYHEGWPNTSKAIVNKFSPVEVEDEDDPSVKVVLKKILAEQERLREDVNMTKLAVEMLGKQKGGRQVGGEKKEPETEEGEGKGEGWGEDHRLPLYLALQLLVFSPFS